MSVPTPQTIFEALNHHGVRYVVIGGLAVQAHGVARSTLDVDIIVDRTPENYRRLRDAVIALGATVPAVDPRTFVELDPTDEVDLARGSVVRITTRAGALDVLRDPPGADHFDRLAARALPVTVLGIEIPIVALDDLIAMKRAIGRPKDLSDIAELTAEP